MKSLQKAITTGSYLLGLQAPDLESALTEVVKLCVERDLVPEESAETLLEQLLKREQKSSSALGDSVAVPHAYFDFLPRQIVVFVRLDTPLPLGAPDGVPTRYLFVLLGRKGHAEEHLETLKSVARLMSDHELRYELGQAEDQEQLLEALRHFEEKTAPPPPLQPAQVPDALRRTGKPFGGVIGDIRRRYPHFRADVRDGLHPKALGSTLFLYFACLAPAVTFGGFMATVTGGSIGAVEMLVASAVCGVIYALFSGQPLIILGGTGPLLVITEVLYILCRQLDLPFLQTYAWVGLWTAALVVIMAAADVSALIRYFTRFTDEIFAALISMIFIVEAVDKLLAYFDGDGGTPLESALLSLLLALGTFYLALSLSRFRKSRFLHSRMREFLADFGPTLAVAAMAGVAYFYFSDVSLQPLDAPDSFGTTSGRPWRIDLFAVPSWVIGAALGPALLTAILVYLDQNITARIVQNPDHKLERGSTYHLDLGLVGVLVAACSLFGLPWLVAATVRSLNHLRSLATTEEVVSNAGDKRDRIIHVRENRVTGVAIHLLVGASLLLLPYLRIIPMAVLYGLFLFMGVVSMSGNQFFERLSLWLMDTSRYPSNHYTRRVPRPVIHVFTLLQAICLAVLWVIKVSVLGILFPLFIALLVPIRLLANRWFSQEHLAALDAEEDPDAAEGQ